MLKSSDVYSEIEQIDKMNSEQIEANFKTIVVKFMTLIVKLLLNVRQNQAAVMRPEDKIVPKKKYDRNED
jgi:hypothetical protein